MGRFFICGQLPCCDPEHFLAAAVLSSLQILDDHWLRAVMHTYGLLSTGEIYLIRCHHRRIHIGPDRLKIIF